VYDVRWSGSVNSILYEMLNPAPWFSLFRFVSCFPGLFTFGAGSLFRGDVLLMRQAGLGCACWKYLTLAVVDYCAGRKRGMFVAFRLFLAFCWLFPCRLVVSRNGREWSLAAGVDFLRCSVFLRVVLYFEMYDVGIGASLVRFLSDLCVRIIFLLLSDSMCS